MVADPFSSLGVDWTRGGVFGSRIKKAGGVGEGGTRLP